MNNVSEKDIESVVAAVLSKYGKTAPAAAQSVGCVPAEVSARHVHLNAAALQALFGDGCKLTPKRDLSQPGQFLSEERVKLVTSKGEIENVGVLGPLREHVQVEVSLTDARMLGMMPPLRLSGDLSGAEDVIIVGPKGAIFSKRSVIIAKAHVHMTKKDASQFGVSDGEHVSAELEGERSVTFGDVIVRVSDKSALALHIDYDEANAAMFSGNGSALIRKKDCSGQLRPPAPAIKERATFAEKKLITEKDAKELLAQGVTEIPAGVMMTPSAKDVFIAAGRTALNSK